MPRLWLLGAALVATACTPFDATSDPTTDEDAGSRDAGADRPALPDPSGDAGDAGDPSTSPCTERHVLCEDFDGQWMGWQRFTHPSSPLNADTTQFVSPPRSLLVEVNPNAEEGHPSYLSRRLPAAQRFTLSADVRAVLTEKPDSEVDVLALELMPPSGFDRYFAAIVLKSDGKLYLEVRVSSSAHTLDNQVELAPIPADFQRVSIDLDLAAGRVVGSAGNGPPFLMDVERAPSTTGTLSVGAAWAQNTRGKYSINVDNVIVD